MNIYVESNFVLELALVQEQHASCENLLRLCESGGAQLVIPAFSLAEPYETLMRRRGQRSKMKVDLEIELSQLSRTDTYTQRLQGFKNLTALLIESADEETKRLEHVKARLLKTGKVIPLEAEVLTEAPQYQTRHGPSPQDALVYASVLSHLKHFTPPQSCFLNKDSHFDDPDIGEELGRHGCKRIPRFDDGYEYVQNRIAG